MIEPLPPGASPIVVVLDRLQWRAWRAGTGWVAMCPAHDDYFPKLAINEANGTVLVFCEAGHVPDTGLVRLTGSRRVHTHVTSHTLLGRCWRSTSGVIHSGPLAVADAPPQHRQFKARAKEVDA